MSFNLKKHFLAVLPFMLFASSIYAADYDASALGPINSGLKGFASVDTLFANITNAVNGGTQTFISFSSLNATAANAVSGGVQIFNHVSSLNASVANAVIDGTQTFNDLSSLNASVANAVSGGTQTFISFSSLNVISANAISGGNQIFEESSRVVVAGGSINSHELAISLNGSGTFFELNGTDARIGSLSGFGTVANASGSATLTIDTSVLGNSTFSGTIDNSNGGVNSISLVKADSGIWNFNGTTTGSSGSTVTVEEGTLAVGAGGALTSISASVDSGASLVANGTVNNSQFDVFGLLGGNGTVGSLNLVIRSGGTLAPGNSIGTLTVNGNVTFAAGSNYNVEVDETGASDLTIVNGNVIINGGTVNTFITPGNYIAGSTISYDILNYTGTLTGTFVGTTTNLAFFSSTLNYSTPGSIFLNLTRNSTNFNDIGGSYNQMQAANGLTSLAGSAIGAAVMGLDVTGVRSAFSQ